MKGYHHVALLCLYFNHALANHTAYFTLMDPNKFVSVVKRLNGLYFPNKRCVLSLQDVPASYYSKRMGLAKLSALYCKS